MRKTFRTKKRGNKSRRSKGRRNKSRKERKTRRYVKKRGGNAEYRLSDQDLDRLPRLDRVKFGNRVLGDGEIANLYCKSRPAHSKLGGPRKCRTGEIIDWLTVDGKRIPSFKCVRENDPNTIKRDMLETIISDSCDMSNLSYSCKEKLKEVDAIKEKEKRAEEKNTHTINQSYRCIGKFANNYPALY